MLIKMRESKGFTLVELMIVVAIIGILAAVAVPYYQRYVQRSKITKYVFPGMRMLQTNLTTYYAVNEAFPDDVIGKSDADLRYVDSTIDMWANSKLYLKIVSGPDDALKAFDGKYLVSEAKTAGDGKLIWEFDQSDDDLDGENISLELGLK